jgi:amino acid transporter
VVGAFVLGTILIAGLMLSTPDSDRTPASQIIHARLGAVGGSLYLLVVAVAILGCGIAVLSATGRMVYAMARDVGSPRWLGLHCTDRHGVPAIATLVVALLAIIPLRWFDAAGVVADAATAIVYTSYATCLLVILLGRARPAGRATLSRRAIRVAVNGAALVIALAMLINLGVPREESNPRISMAVLQDVPVVWPVEGIAVLVASVLASMLRPHPTGGRAA